MIFSKLLSSVCTLEVCFSRYLVISFVVSVFFSSFLVLFATSFKNSKVSFSSSFRFVISLSFIDILITSDLIIPPFSSISREI